MLPGRAVQVFLSGEFYCNKPDLAIYPAHYQNLLTPECQPQTFTPSKKKASYASTELDNLEYKAQLTSAVANVTTTLQQEQVD